jgi:uncharacterized membrane protein
MKNLKTIGIILIVAGAIVMAIAAFDFVQKRSAGSEEVVESEKLPFPWKPTTGAILVAAGIIMLGAHNRKRIM